MLRLACAGPLPASWGSPSVLPALEVIVIVGGYTYFKKGMLPYQVTYSLLLWAGTPTLRTVRCTTINLYIFMITVSLQQQLFIGSCPYQ